MLEKLINYKNDLINQKFQYIKAIEKLPKGTLWIINDNGRKKYVHYVDSNKKYIGKDKDLIRKLSLKKFYEYKLSSINSEIKIVEFCIKKFEKNNMIDFQSKYPNIYDQIKSFNSNKTSWENEEYASTAPYPEQLIISTSKGIKVRSKSESIIVEALANNNVPFRYECDFVTYNKTLHPDFTIKRPKDNKILIWEHFGLLDDYKYRNNAINKLQVYSNDGFVIGDNLIISTETKKNPLSYKKVNDLIHEFIL